MSHFFASIQSHTHISVTCCSPRINTNVMSNTRFLWGFPATPGIYPAAHCDARKRRAGTAMLSLLQFVAIRNPFAGTAGLPYTRGISDLLIYLPTYTTR